MLPFDISLVLHRRLGMGTSTITPCFEREQLKTKTHVGVRPRGVNRIHQAQADPSWSSLAWVSSHKLLPCVHIIWTDQVKEGLDLCMTPQTCCLSVLTHGVPLCLAGRIDSSWCAGPTRTKDRRSVCLRTALSKHCWKRLSWQPSFCAPCLRSCLALIMPCFSLPTGQGWYTGLSHCYAVASVTPWNPLLQLELDGAHAK